jgi:putative membrane protein
MVGLLMRWLVLTLAVWLSSHVVRGVDYDDGSSLLAAAMVLGLLNSLVKPLLVVLALPFVILSFGLFLLFINAFLLFLADKLVPGFHVSGFWPAMGASLIISLLTVLLGSPAHFRGNGRRRRPAQGAGEPTVINRPPPGKGPIIDV